MSQLTSIQNLRNSTAMQSRVENVMRFLTKQNPQWQANWFFPIAVINISNGQDDCSWVRSHTSTHHKGEGNLFIGGACAPADAVIQNLKGFSASQADWAAKLNELLTSAFGVQVDWTQGLTTEADKATEVAGTQAPFEKSATAAASPSAASTSSAAVVRVAKVKKSATPTKLTKLDEAKRLFSDLTPKQKVDLVAWAEEKVASSKACQALAQGVSA